MENMKCGDVESVELEKFRDIVMECTNDECGMRRVGGQRKWWNEVGRAKRRAFEEWLQRRDRVTYDRHRAQSGCETGSPRCKKNGDLGMILG